MWPLPHLAGDFQRSGSFNAHTHTHTSFCVAYAWEQEIGFGGITGPVASFAKQKVTVKYAIVYFMLQGHQVTLMRTDYLLVKWDHMQKLDSVATKNGRLTLWGQ